MSDRKCIFSCSKIENLTLVSDERYKSIVNASVQRADTELCNQITEWKKNQVKCFTHRSCVSTYTSQTHIERYLKKRAAETESNEGSSKRTRRSDVGTFSFQTDCIFCGEECYEKDAKHPGRWCRYSRVRTVERVGKATFKDVILDVCKLRSDDWAKSVNLRQLGCFPDLHASDARYHQDCKKLFMHSKYIELLSQDKSHVLNDDALDTVITTMAGDKSKIWNSVELAQ